MEQFEEKLLRLLADKYRKSKKDSGTNQILRRTRVKPSELYKKYYDNDGDLRQIEAVNDAIESCEGRGFVTFERAGFGYEIAAVYLVDSRLAEVEQYLSKHCGYESKEEKKRYVESLIAQYGRGSSAAALECAKMQAVLDKNQIPKNYDREEEFLKALMFIENNQKPMYIREASMLIYGSSKYFEENTLSRVCRALRLFRKKPCGDGEMPDEILRGFHIEKESRRLCIKGDCSLYMGGRRLEPGALEQGVEFDAQDIGQIDRIKVHAKELMTVENRTSYLRLRPQNAVLFYLGGFADRFQRDFLKKVYQDNRDVTYSHFGDIDAGGFFIHEQLCRLTQIPFQMRYMSKEELSDERFRGCLKPLTPNDRRRLKGLRMKEPYRETVEFMLEHDRKLEQEIVSFYMGE